MHPWHLEARDGCLSRITSAADPTGMNWIREGGLWGKTVLPAGLSCGVLRRFDPRGMLEETYTFTNTTAQDLYCPEGSVAIETPLNDRYHPAEVCLPARCHTHLFCGGQVSWILALRMNGVSPHLGLALTAGSLTSYSVRRSMTGSGCVSNDRGVFLLHPASAALLPGESFRVAWKLFWHDGKEDFLRILEDSFRLPIPKARQWVAFQHETVPWTGGVLDTSQTGEFTLPLSLNGLSTRACFRVMPDPDTLLARRARFIAGRQQCLRGDSHLHGAFLIYDNETGEQHYEHEKHDRNSCRERVGMGVLLALALQRAPDPVLHNSLRLYTDFVLREIYDEKHKTVCNDVQYSLNWHRLYNYPWMAVFFTELYRLYGDPVWILRAADVMEGYYRAGGKDFYAIGIPMLDMVRFLKEAGFPGRAGEMRALFLGHARQIRATGTRYPVSEVDYEQSIVAPAVTMLLMGHLLSGDPALLEAAHAHMKLLTLFHGPQPDYHLNEVAIRHWDGYWFGKRQMPGDTFPHYWNSLSGIAFSLYGRVTGKDEWLEKAERCLRGSLPLFFEDGSASCAMVYPRNVNGTPGHFYDPWANDQDWGLYYYFRRPEWPA